MEKKTKRNSSLELLRIFAMIVIILHHYSVHGAFDLSQAQNNEVIIYILSMGGKVACNIFILITGYFLIESKTNYKKIIKLAVKLFVVSILIFTIFSIFKIIPLDINMKISSFRPLIYGNWFLVYYLLIYIFSPYINLFLHKLDKKQIMKLCFLLILIWSVIPTFSEYKWNFGNFDSFLIMYIIGATIKIFENKDLITKKDNIKNILIAIIIGIIMIFLMNGVYCYNNTVGIKIGKELGIKYFNNINSIFSVLVAIYIFKFFKNMTFYNKGINYISASTLGVYLLHDNDITRNYIWNVLSPNSNYMNSDLLIVHALVKCILVFVICVFIDKILELILKKTVYKYIDKLNLNFNEFWNKILKITNKILI